MEEGTRLQTFRESDNYGNVPEQGIGFLTSEGAVLVGKSTKANLLGLPLYIL